MTTEFSRVAVSTARANTLRVAKLAEEQPLLNRYLQDAIRRPKKRRSNSARDRSERNPREEGRPPSRATHLLSMPTYSRGYCRIAGSGSCCRSHARRERVEYSKQYGQVYDKYSVTEYFYSVIEWFACMEAAISTSRSSPGSTLIPPARSSRRN
jgi:hypothetical protein